MRRIISCILSFIFIISLAFFAVEATEESGDIAFEASGFSCSDDLFDGSRDTYTNAVENAIVSVFCESGIEHLYIEFDRIPGNWELIDKDSGKSEICAKYSFLHEYIDVKEIFGYTPKNLQLNFEQGTVISDIYAFNGDKLPNFVQIWQPPCDVADLMLISSHSDDEQLFFAGILPYYAIERELKVQVVYMVQHFQLYGSQNHVRPHEQLDGLWTVGIKNYPVMSDFGDVYSKSLDRDEAFAQAEKAFRSVDVTYDDFIKYITECIRRFKPLVVVSHDLDGEYGHGTHVFAASALTEAIEVSGNDGEYPESATKYGVWTPEKTYLHLYEDNQIVMNWDTPYESMNGKTPFEMTQLGFQCHKSQHWTWFNRWLNGDGEPITKASQINVYSPCEYGLYNSRVGEDVLKNDFFENVVSYFEREEAKKEEEEKQEQEESKETEESLTETSPDSEESNKTEEVVSTIDEITTDIDDNQNGNGKKLIYLFLALISAAFVVKVVKKKGDKK